MDNASRVNLEKVSIEMVDAALNDKTRFMLYGEDSIRSILRFNLGKKYPQKAFLFKSLDDKRVLTTNAEIEGHIMIRRAPGLDISVKRNNGFTIFEAKSLADLFTCFVLLDK